MKRLLSSRRAKLAVTVVAIAALSGCASVSLSAAKATKRNSHCEVLQR